MKLLKITTENHGICYPKEGDLKIVNQMHHARIFYLQKKKIQLHN